MSDTQFNGTKLGFADSQIVEWYIDSRQKASGGSRKNVKERVMAQVSDPVTGPKNLEQIRDEYFTWMSSQPLVPPDEYGRSWKADVGFGSNSR